MGNQNDNKFLGEEKISKLLLKFSIPCILSMLISSLYNIVDQIFVGNSRIGYLGNAATTVVFPITIITMACAWCLADGGAAYLSLCQGRNDTKNSHKAVGNGILISTILSVIFVVLGFVFMDDLLYAFGASDGTIGLARNYFTIILYGIPVFMFANSVNSIIRADGSPKYSMLATVAGAITNIILDPIFIFGFDWGISGAAWATIIGQFVSFVISVIYFFKSKTFKLSLSSFKLDKKVLSATIKLGISTFITQMAIVVISLVCNMGLAKYGKESIYGIDIPIASMGICMKIFSIVLSIIIGIIVGAQPIIGFNYGAKKYDRVKDTFKLVLKIAIIIGLVFTVVVELWPEVFIGMFGTTEGLYMEFAVFTFRVFLMFVTFTCLIKMISIFFQAVGEPGKSAFASLSRDIIFFVPLVLILPNYFGVKGVLIAAPIADAISMVIATVMIVKFMKNMDNNETKEETAVLKESKPGVIITIAREHGSAGKYIGELVAQKLNIPYYYKEVISLAAQESGLDKEFIEKLDDKKNIEYDLYLSSSPVKYAIEAQDKVIKNIAEKGSCVIVGRAADYVLRDNKNLIRIFLYANEEYKIEKLKEMYGDDAAKAKSRINKSNKNRQAYYRVISGNTWGDYENYDLMLDASIGTEATADVIVDYVNRIEKN